MKIKAGNQNSLRDVTAHVTKTKITLKSRESGRIGACA